MDCEVFYFDGENGCDTCAALTGYYCEGDPGEAHPTCDCEREQVDCSDASIGEIVCELYNIEESWSGQEYQIAGLCPIDWEEQDSILEQEMDEDVFEEYDDCVEDAVKASGWTPAPVESRRFIVTMPANHRGSVIYGIERYIAEFETRTVLVREVDGNEERYAIGHGYGRYERNINIEVLVEDFEPCYMTV